MPRAASIAALLCFASAAFAQTHKVAAPEKVTRAIAVYEWTGDDLKHPTAARLVPVTLFINGHLEDAGVYLAQPMPFAIQTGDVYSIEQAGEPEGTLDIDYARNILTRRTATDDPIGAWYGYGVYAPLAPTPKAPPLKPSSQPTVIVGSNDDDRPHFVGKQPGQPDTTPAPSGTGTSTTTGDDDPDRPHMTRRTDPASTDSTGSVPDDDPDRPTLRHRDPKEVAQKNKKESGSGVTPMDASLNDDPNRPLLHRGKPIGVNAPPELTTLPLDLHQIAAVSDAANRDPHLFTREWDSPTDRADTLAQLEALAQTRVAQYLTTWRLIPPQSAGANPPPPAPATPPGSPASHVRLGPKVQLNPPPPAPPQLLVEKLTPYTLSYGGPPTFVYQAQSPIGTGGPVYITLVAQRLPSGELQIALSNLTDAAHLDRTPWLRLVDAVDPDWSHRASLLFELRGQTSRQFALYRLTSATAQQQFVTGIIE